MAWMEDGDVLVCSSDYALLLVLCVLLWRGPYRDLPLLLTYLLTSYAGAVSVIRGRPASLATAAAGSL